MIAPYTDEELDRAVAHDMLDSVWECVNAENLIFIVHLPETSDYIYSDYRAQVLSDLGYYFPDPDLSEAVYMIERVGE